MTSTSDQPGGHAGPFIVTLCRVAVPVSIRLPPASSLRQYSFFTTRSLQADGTVRLYLQMGYFETLAEAQKCAELMRTTYPEAIGLLAPPEVLQQAGPGIPTLAAAVLSSDLVVTDEKKQCGRP
jgi:hypothetical protein